MVSDYSSTLSDHWVLKSLFIRVFFNIKYKYIHKLFIFLSLTNKIIDLASWAFKRVFILNKEDFKSLRETIPPSLISIKELDGLYIDIM